MWGGTWAPLQCALGEPIVLRLLPQSTQAEAEADKVDKEIDTVHSHALHLVRQRRLLGAPASKFKAHYPLRGCPYTVVQDMWARVSRAAHIHTFVENTTGITGASQRVWPLVQRVVDANRLQEQTLWANGKQEVWVRLGVDGVPLWHSSLVAFSIAAVTEPGAKATPPVGHQQQLHYPYRNAPASADKRRLGVQSAEGCFRVGGYSGKEDVPSLQAFSTATGLLEEAAATDRHVSIGRKVLPCRVFLCGDHMSFVHMRLCWGPGAYKPGHSICQYCQADTKLLEQWPDRSALPENLPLPANSLWKGSKWQVFICIYYISIKKIVPEIPQAEARP
jgi:hypothetical protein